jgi:hypothetical protein
MLWSAIYSTSFHRVFEWTQKAAKKMARKESQTTVIEISLWNLVHFYSTKFDPDGSGVYFSVNLLRDGTNSVIAFSLGKVPKTWNIYFYFIKLKMKFQQYFNFINNWILTVWCSIHLYWIKPSAWEGSQVRIPTVDIMSA